MKRQIKFTQESPSLCLEGNRAEAGSGRSWKEIRAKLGQVEVCWSEESLDFQAEAH